MIPTDLSALSLPLTASQLAVDKFYSLIDVPAAPSTLCRRIFFDVLRNTSITLSKDEIETCEAIATLLAELEQAHPGRAVA